MYVDDAKGGEITENEDTVAAITEAPVATSSEMVPFEPTQEARAEVDPTSAIVPAQKVAAVESVPMLSPVQSIPVLSVLVQRVTTSDALILTPEATPAATAVQAKNLRLQNLAAKRKEEEQKKKEAEITKDTVRGVVEAKDVSYFKNQVAILNQLYKNEFMSITKDEFLVCFLQAKIQACGIVIEMINQHRVYNEDEKTVMRDVVHGLKPIFNTKQA